MAQHRTRTPQKVRKTMQAGHTTPQLRRLHAGPRVGERGFTFTARAWLLLATLLYTLSQCEQNIGATAHPLENPKANWSECQKESGNLYLGALDLYNATRTFHSFSADFTMEIPRVSCHHHCDPRTLRKDPDICLRQVHHVLHWYHNAFQLENVFSSFEARLIHGIKHSLHRLEVSLGAATKQKIEALDIPPVQNWEISYFAQHVAQNLLTFSSLVARIFHPGNPANHSEQ
ncbi:interleukin-23 subunit alpha [Lissotriton helveticus]